MLEKEILEDLFFAQSELWVGLRSGVERESGAF